MLGKAKLEINRKDMYPKEIDLITSTSYGPGRYDDSYEISGIDYPYHYVRRTERRNLEEFVRLIHKKHINLSPLIDKVYKINKAEEAFDYIQNSSQKPLLVLLEYNKLKKINFDESYIKNSSNQKIKSDPNVINVALIGASPFAKNVHIPNFLKLNDKYKLKALMTKTGINAIETAKENNFDYCTSSFAKIINDKSIDLVFITSNQGSHGKYVLKALKSGKNVFVEKPLSIYKSEIEEIIEFYKENSGPILMVGYNRRFSSYAREIKSVTSKRISPLFINYRMNAGFKPKDSLIFKEGGRIIGEGCHIIDLFSFLVDSKIKSISYESVTSDKSKYLSNDNKSVVIKYDDGSVCSLNYFSMGSKDLEKEFMEVHFDNKTILLYDYKYMESFGINLKEIKSVKSDKGHYDELLILHECLMGKNRNWPISLESMIETSLATFLIK